MKAYPGKLHIGSDGWSSPNVVAFLGVTVHWIVDCKMVSTILDFIKYAIVYLLGIESHSFTRATQAHTGAYLAARLAECLREFGIQNKVHQDLDLLE